MTTLERASRGLLACVALLTISVAGTRAFALCASDSECDDGLFCNGTETCNLLTQLCEAGTAASCGLGAADPECNDASCVDPTGCIVTPRIDGFGCLDDDVCTTSDICQNGVCVGMGGADSDGDGFCDIEETAAQCHADDAAEIPYQSNVYSGGRGNSGGEILLTFRSPNDRDVRISTNPSCAVAGQCNLVTGFCTSGKVSDPCDADSDCNQPLRTCRIVLNYAGVPDLGQQLQDRRPAFSVVLKIPRYEGMDLTSVYEPVTPGCSRKVDVTLPADFVRASLRFKARGTTAGKRRTDRDRVKFIE